jgi:hypothetical protein
VLIYGVGVPFLLVLASSFLGTKQYSAASQDTQEKTVKKGYGTCKDDETSALVEYVH